MSEHGLTEAQANNNELVAYRFGLMESNLKQLTTCIEELKTGLTQMNTSMEVLKANLQGSPRCGESISCIKHGEQLMEQDRHIATLQKSVDERLSSQGQILDNIQKKLWIASGVFLALNGLISFLPLIIKTVINTPAHP